MSSRIGSQSPTHKSPPTGEPMTVDEQTMRRVAALFVAGVTVVTTRHAEGLHGITVSAFLAASWDPPLALVSLESVNQSCDFIKESRTFAVSFLSDGQEFLAERFAGRAPLVNRRFDGVPHRFAVTGAPILEGALGWLDCRAEQIVEVGDHTLFIGRVVALGEGAPGNALAYYAHRYRTVEP
ncbi:MAG TPA: flavin reductase family protein [Anaerolineae bacterium]|nr:flavin reductase family protein [Anaerolineae bacterium]